MIIDVLVGIGPYLLFVVFWIIHKVNMILIKFTIIVIFVEVYLFVQSQSKINDN